MNVVKHSGASKVHIEMKEEEKQLKITVQDDGKGINYSPEMLRLKSTGFGLFSIQERLEDLGGKMEVYTTPGEGTEVTMLLPLNEWTKDKQSFTCG